MLASAGLIVLFLLALLLVPQMRRSLGAGRGTALAALLILTLGSAWGTLEWKQRREPPPPEDQTASVPVSSQACLKCHESHYASWRATYHRSMTREATPENVKADFNNAVHHYLGVESRMIRLGERFFIETIDPPWEMQAARQGVPLDKVGKGPRRVYSVDRLVGSHWFQQMLHRDDHGRYARLPLVYHVVEKRWIHINGVFLFPNKDVFHSRIACWNESCVYCHNTRPSKNPLTFPDGQPGYNTEVGELGISCEACHGAGEGHVRAHQNPARRMAQHYSGEVDPTIINPAKLSVQRCDEICARCHGALVPRLRAWNPYTYADPFLAGRELSRFWLLGWSEAELHRHASGQGIEMSTANYREPIDGRFWGDGTPLTTAVEYQGMALSACYQNGRGQMRCISCHSMHQADPDHQVKPGMRTNEACYGCHESYRTGLTAHTHHAADSSGSLCFNCHMPHQVFSLLDTHRSHRIAVPRVRDSVGTGKPHACNLCHLDKSLGWTQEQLGNWYGSNPMSLSDDDQTLASSLLYLTQSDARSRAIVAGAFSRHEAQQVSGKDWPDELLLRMLEHERYEAVRYLLHRGLRSLHAKALDNLSPGQPGYYDYQGSPAGRAAQLRAMRELLEGSARPRRGHHPYLPLTSDGRFAKDVLDRLLKGRNDPDVSVNE
jgi:predicted CXXCH cytochrome family protein